MKDNHEEHEGREEHEKDPFSVRRMRAASPLSPEAERIMHETIGSAIAVHRALGPGFLESIYRKAMCIELESRKLTYDCERPIEVSYRGIAISGQRVDLIVGGLIVVELKAVAGLEEIHRAQVISYLRTMSLRGGLLINFRVRVLKEGSRESSCDPNVFVIFDPSCPSWLQTSEGCHRCVHRAPLFVRTFTDDER